MRKFICLFAVVFYCLMVLAIPLLFFALTQPTAVNLFLCSLLTAISGLGAFGYYEALKQK